QDLRCRGDQPLAIVSEELTFELVDLDRVERLQREQRIHEEAIAARSRYAPCGSMRARDEAEVFQVRHDVADARRRQIETGILRQRARADGLAFGDIALYQRFQQNLRALAQDRDVVRHEL